MPRPRPRREPAGRLELRALQALAHAAVGDEPAALAALIRTLLVDRRKEAALAGTAAPNHLARLVEAFE